MVYKKYLQKHQIFQKAVLYLELWIQISTIKINLSDFWNQTSLPSSSKHIRPFLIVSYEFKKKVAGCFFININTKLLRAIRQIYSEPNDSNKTACENSRQCLNDKIAFIFPENRSHGQHQHYSVPMSHSDRSERHQLKAAASAAVERLFPLKNQLRC